MSVLNIKNIFSMCIEIWLCIWLLIGFNNFFGSQEIEALFIDLLYYQHQRCNSSGFNLNSGFFSYCFMYKSIGKWVFFHIFEAFQVFWTAMSYISANMVLITFDLDPFFTSQLLSKVK